ncbi:MAG: hypothetical protein ACI4P6_04255 [Candidatus Spyradosoma sp.]
MKLNYRGKSAAWQALFSRNRKKRVSAPKKCLTRGGEKAMLSFHIFQFEPFSTETSQTNARRNQDS